MCSIKTHTTFDRNRNEFIRWRIVVVVISILMNFALGWAPDFIELLSIYNFSEFRHRNIGIVILWLYLLGPIKATDIRNDYQI